jgi:uncharacterized membrane protein/protein-disulfide isomerase
VEASRSAGPSGIVLAVRVLSGIAFLIAAYLAYKGLFNSLPAGCSGGGGCDAVLSSRWSRLWGVPVSVPGLFVYLGVFIGTFFVARGGADQRRRDGWTVLTALAVFAGLGAIWFIYLQFFIIQSICPYCMADHVCGLLIAVLVLAGAPVARGERLPRGRSSLVLGGARVGLLVAGASCIMGLFMVAQLVFEAPTHRISGTLDMGAGGKVIDMSSTPAASKQDGGKSKTNKDGEDVEDPVLTTPSGKAVNEKNFVGLGLPQAPNGATVLLGRTDFPVRGNVDAPFVFVCLVDYTCPHCRAFHKTLDKSFERYGEQVAFMILPMPLNADCNPFIYATDERHKWACDLAHLSVAVWKTDAAKFAQFDDWLFQPDQARTGPEARAEAERLVGKEALKATLDSGWPKQKIQKHIKVYEMAGQGQIPKVMYRALQIAGTTSSESFFKILEDLEKLGLEPKKK